MMNELGDLGVVGATGKSAYIIIYIVSWEELEKPKKLHLGTFGSCSGN